MEVRAGFVMVAVSKGKWMMLYLKRQVSTIFYTFNIFLQENCKNKNSKSFYRKIVKRKIQSLFTGKL